MDKVMENVSDRELFSELVDNPINPLHVHIVPPFVKENNPMFYLQINGEAAFKWRDSYGQPCKVFNLLQRSILPLGYQLMASAEERVGKAFSESIRRFWREIQAIKNGNSLFLVYLRARLSKDWVLDSNLSFFMWILSSPPSPPLLLLPLNPSLKPGNLYRVSCIFS